MRNFTVILFFISFLYPQVHKAVHDFSHRHDVVCSAQTEKHFHEHEHSCPVCDYKLPVSEPANFFIAEIFSITLESGSVSYPTFFLSSKADLHSSPRAPPVSAFISA